MKYNFTYWKWQKKLLETNKVVTKNRRKFLYIDWLISWFIHWLIYLFIDWVIEWVIDWLIYWLVSWLIDSYYRHYYFLLLGYFTVPLWPASIIFFFCYFCNLLVFIEIHFYWPGLLLYMSRIQLGERTINEEINKLKNRQC